MIAPLRPPDTTTRRVSRRLYQARDFVAATLLRPPPESGPPIAAWKAWAFVAWLAVVTVAFAVSMWKAL
ncbi:MAG: hypothetical protein NTW96_21920 [Planctomycetia bacterium]|nr:hypothetical protein [Planctomycetia bacterium]